MAIILGGDRPRYVERGQSHRRDYHRRDSQERAPPTKVTPHPTLDGASINVLGFGAYVM